ncbi:MAG: hypothetical protein K0B81_01740 [Candidatus Cloacimonetes bacterium]|nr:hypothetical protein [Candidatus Cloacimonadota bacterium]
MKRLILVLMVLFIFASTALMAEFNPYGSARIGYWYNSENEDWSSTGENELNMDYYLQSNSRFGARFNNDDVSGRVEFGGTGSIRLLYGKYKMSGWSLLIGQEQGKIEMKSKQVWGSDKNLVGWGGIDESRKPQIRIEVDNGLYLSFIQPEKVNAQGTGTNQDKKVLLPKINLGYSGKFSENIKFHGTFGVNHYTYNDNAGDLDQAVLAYILGLLLDFNFDPIMFRTHFNYGQNTKHYGLNSVTPNTAIYEESKDEIVDVTTMGGFGEFTYKMSPQTAFTVGVSYVTSNSDSFDNAESAMAAFVQIEYRLHRNFHLIPEVGYLDKMKDINDNDLGNMVYFGTQLRMDF